jgi:hypothetical protein
VRERLASRVLQQTFLRFSFANDAAHPISEPDATQRRRRCKAGETLISCPRPSQTPVDRLSYPVRRSCPVTRHTAHAPAPLSLSDLSLSHSLTHSLSHLPHPTLTYTIPAHRILLVPSHLPPRIPPPLPSQTHTPPLPPPFQNPFPLPSDHIFYSSSSPSVFVATHPAHAPPG